MVILFTLWFVLQWQFPTWLWVFSGFFYVLSLRPKKRKRKTITAKTNVLPFYLALAIIFGTNILGEPILPVSVSTWTIFGIFIGSILIRLIVLRPDKIIKKELSKTKKSDSSKSANFTLDGSGLTMNDNEDDELKLHVKIQNKEKNKNSNFKISLENGFIKEKFIQKVALKGIKNIWKNPMFQDDEGQPLFDIEKIYNNAKKNPVKGEVLFEQDNDKFKIIICIK